MNSAAPEFDQEMEVIPGRRLRVAMMSLLLPDFEGYVFTGRQLGEVEEPVATMRVGYEGPDFSNKNRLVIFPPEPAGNSVVRSGSELPSPEIDLARIIVPFCLDDWSRLLPRPTIYVAYAQVSGWYETMLRLNGFKVTGRVKQIDERKLAILERGREGKQERYKILH